MSNIQSQFTDAQIKALISGETVSFSDKTNKTTDTQVESHPVADENKPKTFTPKTSVSIGKVEKVTGPNVRSATGELVRKAGDVVSPRFEENSPLARSEAARRLKEEEAKAQAAELASQLSPAQLLNKLNATHRVVEKLQKEVAALKKSAKQS